MKPIIIGIHGLKNKPAKKLLESWWIKSIRDGLQYYNNFHDSFKFELCYWADMEYEKPLDPQMEDEDDPLYLKEPYTSFEPPKTEKEINNTKRKILDKLEIAMDNLFLREDAIEGIEKIADLTIRKMFADLDTYYHGNCSLNQNEKAKTAFRNRLAQLLKKYKNHDILILAHSMGTIISYDTLLHVIPNLKIDTFITLGSPLGLPVITKKILLELGKKIDENSQPPVPDNIRNNWFNFSDLDDNIAANYNLADDYNFNKNAMLPKDNIVNNEYIYDGQKNPHKVYGYLRTPQVAEAIYNFLNRKDSFLTEVLKRMGIR
ncbi:MAG: GPI inositol-deacylase [Candidatus Cloacimonetes bacterium]|nr:GPI inositol-deacylase [Candidatus Cloacimonadota bacterium]MCF7814164.1 GPI inositol-deacylase [Candidatus Cloacimonadota bacterium]MCF7868773.1 GPI inositol-deacylase [Candidatus Cloacimonadota bacterium]MCF7884176.1 GPI inositol-deacylase [Candidatus Cloacimonadota bacterium]